jgi:hypothetical protein
MFTLLVVETDIVGNDREVSIKRLETVILVPAVTVGVGRETVAD